MKIEFDLPEFDKELKVEITIKKDGEVVYSASTTPSKKKEDVPETSAIETSKKKLGGKSSKQEVPVVTEEVKPKRNLGGNLMGMEF